jgi:signal transduction histidine kinase
VTVHLRHADGIWLRVIDDGRGFDPSNPHSGTSFGLKGMKERTESLGGHFQAHFRAGPRHVGRGPAPLTDAPRP